MLITLLMASTIMGCGNIRVEFPSELEFTGKDYELIRKVEQTCKAENSCLESFIKLDAIKAKAICGKEIQNETTTQDTNSINYHRKPTTRQFSGRGHLGSGDFTDVPNRRAYRLLYHRGSGNATLTGGE